MGLKSVYDDDGSGELHRPIWPITGLSSGDPSYFLAERRPNIFLHTHDCRGKTTLFLEGVHGVMSWRVQHPKWPRQRRQRDGIHFRVALDPNAFFFLCSHYSLHVSGTNVYFWFSLSLVIKCVCMLIQWTSGSLEAFPLLNKCIHVKIEWLDGEIEIKSRCWVNWS